MMFSFPSEVVVTMNKVEGHPSPPEDFQKKMMVALKDFFNEKLEEEPRERDLCSNRGNPLLEAVLRSRYPVQGLPLLICLSCSSSKMVQQLYHLGALESRGSRMTGAISKYDLVNNSRSQ